MKFQFMSMSLSYFSSLNMLKQLRDMNSDTTSAAVAASAGTATLTLLVEHTLHYQITRSMYTLLTHSINTQSFNALDQRHSFNTENPLRPLTHHHPLLLTPPPLLPRPLYHHRCGCIFRCSCCSCQSSQRETTRDGGRGLCGAEHPEEEGGAGGLRKRREGDQQGARDNERMNE